MGTCREEEESTKCGLQREGALGISAFKALRCHLFVALLGFTSLSNSRALDSSGPRSWLTQAELYLHSVITNQDEVYMGNYHWQLIP